MKKIWILCAWIALAAAPAMALDGKALYNSKSCGMCHGPGGMSSNKMFPSLAGKDASFLALETMKIKDGRRTGPMSNAMKNNSGVKHLTEAEAQAIGEYLASVK